MRRLRISDTPISVASTSQPRTLAVIGGVAHGEAGAQRAQRHGPPANPGTIPWVTERRSRSQVISRSELQRCWLTTTRYTAIQPAVNANDTVHSRAPARHT